MNLTTLSDAELLACLDALSLESHNVLAKLLVHLGEIEERRLHLKAACSSMFEFCVRRLRMSEGAAYRRITAARLVRRFPNMLSRIALGDVHLSAIVLVRDIVNETNVETVLDAVAGKSKRDVQEVVARYAPKPDVPAVVRKLPVAAAPPTPPTPRPQVQTAVPMASPAANRPTPGAALPRAAVTPLSFPDAASARYKVQLTASAELREKLERATALLRHRNPTGELAVVLERVLDALLEKLEKELLAATAHPRPSKTARETQPGYVPRAVRREVFARDGAQCTFTDESAQRCLARDFLELDHIEPRARGGPDDASNLRVRCRAHNLLHAEENFGKEHVRERIHLRQRKSTVRDKDGAEERTAAKAKPRRAPSRRARRQRDRSVAPF